jgi:hypothetical protein
MNEQEERLVAELQAMGVGYLSRQTVLPDQPARSADQFLADLIRQPTSRVRTAVIAVLLARPGIASSIPAACSRLKNGEQTALKILYTAAVILQQKYAARLQEFQVAPRQTLPDLYSADLGVAPNAPPEVRLRNLGLIHRQLTGSSLNWVGTYENVAHHLIRRWEKERLWNQ